ncbi:MAG: hypothetical protein KKA07_18875 [Bacteroidetes bacterium]|nr:hypothetical protein [Bacteroidota bacterium]MBU1721137.1 hypothetical protein [Bacteroidota bacterium]
MQHLEPLLPNKFYHIYNRGINSCDLFRQEPDNYLETEDLTGFQNLSGLVAKTTKPVRFAEKKEMKTRIRYIWKITLTN